MPLPDSAHQICSDDVCECRGWTAPGAMTTLVMVTRANFELCGESNWSEVTPRIAQGHEVFRPEVLHGLPNVSS